MTIVVSATCLKPGGEEGEEEEEEEEEKEENEGRGKWKGR